MDINQFKSEEDYVNHMKSNGYTAPIVYGSTEYSDAFKEQYFVREYHRIKTINTLFERIEALELRLSKLSKDTENER